VGLDAPDDAGVFRLGSGLALVQSVDFFTPIVDDPYDWGRIAAANALSDIFAMGARPLTALQIVAWPRDDLPLGLLADVQRGGAEVLGRVGCVLLGGHSIDDSEPKYGMAVTGLADPDRLMTNAGARPGDVLVLTKPIGSGLVATAIKRDLATEEEIAAAVASMVTLNDEAAQAAMAAEASAATDVTGFGLLGHLRELTVAHGLGARVDSSLVPLLPGAMGYAESGVIAGGSQRNLESADEFTDFGGVAPAMRTALTDAQTSGGLLIAVAPAGARRLQDELPMAVVVGEVEASPGLRVV
jgi:selenide,water dikinase